MGEPAKKIEPSPSRSALPTLEMLGELANELAGHGRAHEAPV